MTINERIKYIRKSPELNKSGKMTQDKFAEKLGIKKSALSHIETGKSSATNYIIKSICREFSVSETWLRDGTGQPFLEISPDAEIAAFVDEIMQDVSNDFRARFVGVLSRLTPDEWGLLEKHIKEMFPESDESGADPDGTEPENGADPARIQTE